LRRAVAAGLLPSFLSKAKNDCFPDDIVLSPHRARPDGGHRRHRPVPGPACFRRARGPDKPLVLEADNASYDDVKQIYTLTGNVVLTKGTMVLKSDAAELRTDPEGYQYAIATSKPGRQAYIRQNATAWTSTSTAGATASNTTASRINKLIGHARAARVSGVGAKIIDEIRGAVITYDSRNEFYTATGGDSNTAAGNRRAACARAVAAPDASAARRGRRAADLKPSARRPSPERFKPPQMNDTATLAAQASASAVRADSSTLVVRHLKKRYGSRTVVKDVSLDVKSGEVVGLLGPNGAGKTTSFYMIVGLVALDEGDIVLDGQHISGLAIHERARMGLSYLPQEASVFRKLNVEENIRAVLELQVKTASRCPSRNRSPARLAARRPADRPPAQQPGAVAVRGRAPPRGNRARAGLRAALHLLDEPFAGVDPIAVGEIQRIVSFLKARNIGVLITDHNVRETLGICDHAYIISEGTVLAAGSRGNHRQRVRAARLSGRKLPHVMPARQRAFPRFRQLAVGDHEVEAIDDSNFRSNIGKMRIE
jgi:lipopolysaccharide export system ATP-binding protein